MSGFPRLGYPAGMIGATAPSRYVGGTVTGHPVTGTFRAGDFVIAQDGVEWLCTADGSPGTWAQFAAVVGAFLTVAGDLSDVANPATSLANIGGVPKASDANRNTAGPGTGVLGALTTGTDMTGAGYHALDAATSGIAHTAFGAHALRLLTSGLANCAFGGAAMAEATTAEANCAFGNMTLEVCQDGTWNVAVGASAMNYFQHPQGCTAVGFQALPGNLNQALNTGNYDAAFGFEALHATAAGSTNTGIGPRAGRDNVNGNNNTFLGASAGIGANVAGHSTVNGSQNTWLGTQAGPGDASDPSACLAIGYNATCIGSGSVAIGTDHTNAGAAATAQDQIVLGTALHTVTVPGVRATVGEVVVGETGFGAGYAGLKFAGLPAASYGILCEASGNTFLNAGNGAAVTHRIANATQMTMTAGELALADAVNLAFGTVTGTKIGTAVGQKLGFWGKAPVAQQARPVTLGDVIALGTLIGLWA